MTPHRTQQYSTVDRGTRNRSATSAAVGTSSRVVAGRDANRRGSLAAARPVTAGTGSSRLWRSGALSGAVRDACRRPGEPVGSSELRLVFFARSPAVLRRRTCRHWASKEISEAALCADRTTRSEPEEGLGSARTSSVREHSRPVFFGHAGNPAVHAAYLHFPAAGILPSYKCSSHSSGWQCPHRRGETD
jgi:hypothetical protein